MKRKLPIASLAVLLSLTVGCGLLKKPAITPVPGQVNQFDGDTYTTLITAKAVIDQTKADLAASLFPSAWVPNIKKAVNAAVSAYNVADLTYQQYHTSAVVGQATAVQQAAVNAAITNLNSATAGITSAKAGN